MNTEYNYFQKTYLQEGVQNVRKSELNVSETNNLQLFQNEKE